jgi:hypothetical protein
MRAARAKPQVSDPDEFSAPTRLAGPNTCRSRQRETPGHVPRTSFRHPQDPIVAFAISLVVGYHAASLLREVLGDLRSNARTAHRQT